MNQCLCSGLLSTTCKMSTAWPSLINTCVVGDGDTVRI